MNATRKPTEIKVYWDTQDPNNEGWAYTAYTADRVIASGPIDADADDLDNAIAEACRELDVDLTPDHFCRDNVTDGGFACWAKD